MLSTCTPATLAEAAALVRDAAAAGQSVYPQGGGTLYGYGLPPFRPGVVLNLSRLNRVIDYPARDMTITAEAGLTIAELQKALAAEGQTLPVDVPQPDRTTLGGALAANLSGPRRFGHGTLRDFVIGISFLDDQGNECKAGGRVVKNVAGYDLCKLMIGAWGTLGVLTQVTLKVRPRPEAAAAMTIPAALAKLEPLLAAVHETKTRPAAVSYAWEGGEGRLLVAFEEMKPTVAWQMEQLARELQPFGAAAPAESAALTKLTEFPLPPTEAPWVWKASVPPSRVAAMLAQAEPHASSLVAHAASGIVWGHAGAAFGPAELEALRRRATEWGGSLVVWRAPEAQRRREMLWGPDRPDFAMMRRIKAALDPKGVFNPGRFEVG